MVSLLEKIEDGRAQHSDLDLLRTVCDRVEGRSLCALGDFAVWCVGSYVEKFREEFQRHVDEGRCPYGGESSTDGVPAPSGTSGPGVGTRRPCRRPGSRAGG